MSLLESVLYGFMSGITSFLPVSSRGHEALLLYIFGVDTRDSFLDLLVHIGTLLSIFLGCSDALVRIRSEQRSLSVSRRRRLRSAVGKSYYELKLLKTAAVPLTAGLLLCVTTSKMQHNLILLMLFFAVNALFLLLADHTSHGNRDARTMTGLDGIILGIAGALSVFPGISRTGMICAYATARGADNQNAVNWAVLLGIPALLFSLCLDLFSLLTGGIAVISFSLILSYILSGAAAFAAGYLGITLFRLVLNHSGLSGFAYYSIGTSFLSFIFYLIT